MATTCSSASDHSMNLKQALQDILPADELSLLVRSYDMIGDIAVIIIPPPLLHHERLIGDTILSMNKRIRVVARRAGHHGGEYRTLPLTVIAGEQRLTTMHREFGVSLELDLSEIYFSPRSGNERKRIVDQVIRPEQVLVMFSGAAPYPLQLARHSPAATVVGVEKNIAAHRYGLINVRKNKAQAVVSLICGDVIHVIPELDHSFDRVIMPLPGTARQFLDLAIEYLRPSGRLHLYEFQPRGQFAESEAFIRKAARLKGRSILDSVVTVCGHNSPSSYRICVDATIS
ncbi:methyltransferase [Desulfofustis glycolicus DSM 9705]|uniref:Methyltransferase n=2 Tax=Desulfofustis glycolicus TaxID=51195 RepID=A0A1M5XVJ2_9BACT|nr:methyltransferase [Desulfofustis glycolicus DSM 9705]